MRWQVKKWQLFIIYVYLFWVLLNFFPTYLKSIFNQTRNLFYFYFCSRCVRLARFENDRTISFIPPDGAFDLMTYRLSTQVFFLFIYYHLFMSCISIVILCSHFFTGITFFFFALQTIWSLMSLYKTWKWLLIENLGGPINLPSEFFLKIAQCAYPICRCTNTK